MTDRFNTIAGWTLFAGIVALGLSSLSGHIFEADRPERPETLGYPIAGAVEEGDGAEGPSLAVLLATADPAKGEAVFAKCVSCHTVDQGGANGIGPNLWSILGMPIGKHAAGFAYSSALAGHGGEWTFENMDAWLKSPRAFASGTKMSFAGLSNPEDRANLIVYLNSKGSGLPLPTPEAPAEAATPEGGPEDAPGAGPGAGVEGGEFTPAPAVDAMGMPQPVPGEASTGAIGHGNTL
ncbi:c-type cytochrome [Altericroceibacterium xinjiangense]|uniref:c-type cytochrome n=1 Tax=Altericroceibacterium xinjiangense TaxID=762261 RepID=UPI000F7D5B38|nr:cytochrome c family protein [Altericroceibacterium xinjiangense]